MTNPKQGSPPSRNAWPAWQTLAIGLALALAIGLAYANTWHVPFVFDDTGSIGENPTIRRLAWTMFSPPHGAGLTVEGRPLLNVSLAFNYAWGGTAVEGYHVLNIVIHLLAALTLFGLGRRTLRRANLAPALAAHATEIAFAAAALWALHPLQTESVTYVVQRTESLMGLFYLFTLYAFVRGTEAAKGARWFTAALAACALGMATKEVMVSAPIVVWLYDRTFIAGSFRGAWRARRGVYLGLAATWLILAALVLGTGSRGGTIGASAGVAWWQYAFCQARAIVHYLRLAGWPSPLIFDYGADFVSFGAMLPYALLDLALLGATVFALWRRPALGFLGAWFFLILAPTSSVLGGTRQMLAEHRMYLSLAAPAVLAAIGFRRWLGSRSWVAWTMVAGLLAVLTAQRNHDYRNAIALYRDTVAKRPENGYAHHNLAQALLLAGDTTGAVKEFTTALQLAPAAARGTLLGAPMAENNLAGALAKAGRTEEAIAHARAALALKPNYAEAHYNLATSLLRLGQTAAAIAEFELALRLDPNFAPAHSNLGRAFFEADRLPEAIAQFETALRLEPDNLSAHLGLANAFSAAGRPADAITHYEAVVRAAPDNADYHNNLGSALFESSTRIDEAIAQFETSLRLQPGSAETHCNLGVVLATRGQRAEALRHLEEAVRLRPDYAFARDELAKVRSGGRP